MPPWPVPTARASASAIASSLRGQVAGEGGDVLVDGPVCLVEDPLALLGQAQRDLAPVVLLLAPIDQASGDEPVDQRRDGRAPHGQAVGEAGRGRRALGQDAEHPELGEGQVDGAERHLDPLRQPGRDAAVGAQHAGRGGRRGRRPGRAWVFRPGAASVEGGVVTDTSTIIQLEPLTTCGRVVGRPGHQPTPVALSPQRPGPPPPSPAASPPVWPPALPLNGRCANFPRNGAYRHRRVGI